MEMFKAWQLMLIIEASEKKFHVKNCGQREISTSVCAYALKVIRLHLFLLSSSSSSSEWKFN